MTQLRTATVWGGGVAVAALALVAFLALGHLRGAGAVAGSTPARDPAPASVAARDSVHVGRSNDGLIAVAVAVHDGHATAYVTDGVDQGSWFGGAATGGPDRPAPDMATGIAIEDVAFGPPARVRGGAVTTP